MRSLIFALAFSIPFFWVTVWLLGFSARLFFWVLETYSDSSLARWWRSIITFPTTNQGKALRRPIWTIAAIFGGLAVFLEQLHAPAKLTTLIGEFAGCVVLVALLCHLPVPLPSWLDGQWQWNKRHGFIDTNGKLIETGGSPSAAMTLTLQKGRIKDLSATIALPTGWRMIPLDSQSVAHVNIPAMPLAPLFVLLQGPTDALSTFPATLAVTVTPSDTRTPPTVGVLSDRLSKTIQNWVTLEELKRTKPRGAVMCTGIYSEGGVSFTVIQWTWKRHIDRNTSIAITATATTTTRQYPHVVDDMIKLAENMRFKR